jgi:hypothetical protein
MTTNKGLNQPANGSNVDTWDVPVNNNFGWIDQAFGSTTALNATSGSVTLTDTQYRSLILAVSGAIAANVTYTIPSSVGGQWIVYNTTTDSVGGPWTITVASAGGGTSVVIQRSKATLIISDGTNIRSVYAESLAAAVPSGLISMWSGSIATIPSGWYLCNGSNGTPDLRDRFVVGAGSTYAVAATGGTADAVVVAHTHTATSAVTDPQHTHNFSSVNSTSSGSFFTDHSGSDTREYSNTTQTAAASTGITVATTVNSTGSSGTNANLPPYYALAYIMKS